MLRASTASLDSLLTESLLKVVFVGILVAVLLSWLVMNKWLEDFAFRIQLKWWRFALADGTSVIIATVTLRLQAVRAAIANTMKSFRTE